MYENLFYGIYYLMLLSSRPHKIITMLLNNSVFRISYVFFILVVAGMVISGCSKEELDIRDVSFDELRSSYYVLGANTIEISVDQQKLLLISKTDDFLSFNNDDLFNDIKV